MGPGTPDDCHASSPQTPKERKEQRQPADDHNGQSSLENADGALYVPQGRNRLVSK